MNLILLAAVITLTSAAQLPSRNYIPQGQGQSGISQGSGGFGGSSGSFGGSSGGFGGSSGGFGGSSAGSGSNGQFGGSHGGFGGQSGGAGGNGNTRPQQNQEKNAAVLKQDQEIDESGSYHFGYETENGIRAEEAGNPAEAQGGFSYKGDDGNTYTVTYTSGEGGFRPQGEHLPVPPPTPEAILEALQKNAQDEAAGIFDDGLYHPDAQSGPGGNKPGQNGGQFGNNGNNNRPSHGNGNRPGQGASSFGGNGNHQNGFNPNSGYTY